MRIGALGIGNVLLARNDALAAANRTRLAAARPLVLNLVSGPGAGKTTLLVETLRGGGRTAPTQAARGQTLRGNGGQPRLGRGVLPEAVSGAMRETG